MSSLNLVQVIGNVGKDPEIRSLGSGGGRVANFSVATSDRWKDKNTGQVNERTEWHRVACFNEGLIGVIEKYVKKGSKVYISGQLQTRKWQDQQGQDRYSTEIVMRAYRGELVLLGGRQNGDQVENGAEQSAMATATGSTLSDLDDEVPF